MEIFFWGGGDQDRLLSGPNFKNAIHVNGRAKTPDTVEDKDIKCSCNYVR